MNNEDSFSKIFRKAADEIEEQPSSDLWNRLESRLNEDSFAQNFREASEQIEEKPAAEVWNRLSARLDQAMPLAQKQASGGRIISFSRRWMAAASMVVMICVMVGIISMLNRDKQNVSDLAQTAPTRNELEDVVLVNENLPIAALTQKEQAARLAKADKIQAENILIDAKAGNAGSDKISSVEEKVILKDNATEFLDDVVSMEIESPSYTATNSMSRSHAGATTTTATTVYGLAGAEPVVSTNSQLLRESGNVVERNSSNRYADIVPMVNNAAVYEDLKNDEDWNQNIALEQERQRKTITATTAGKTNMQKDIVRPSQETKNSTTKAKAADADNENRLHSSLQIFDWLVGTWKDSKQYAGVSYEEWQVKDAYTLVGKCYVVNETMNSRLFQEQIRITFDKNLRQVFLYMTLDDSGKEVDFMLSGYDLTLGEYIFQQVDYPEYPERIILERGDNLASFATIIVDKNTKKNTLNTDQQRYLDNRNHVTGERAVRNMTRVNK